MNEIMQIFERKVKLERKRVEMAMELAELDGDAEKPLEGLKQNLLEHIGKMEMELQLIELVTNHFKSVKGKKVKPEIDEKAPTWLQGLEK